MSSGAGPTVIHTSRLPEAVTELLGDHVRLVPLRVEHAADVWPAADDDAIRRWWPRRWKSQEDVEAQFRHLLGLRDEGKAEPFLILARQPGGSEVPAGSTSFYGISREHRHLSIGWTWLLAPYRRSPVNTETKRLLMREAFDERAMVRVQFDVDSRNAISRAAVERLGAKLDGVLRYHKVLWDGYIRDTCVYSVVRDEWPDVEARLVARLQRRGEGA